MVFAAAASAGRFYWDNLPVDTMATVGKSAAFTFTIWLITRNPTYFSHTESTNLAPALNAAGLAAYASLIHALVTPIFNKIFGDDEILFHREFVKRLVVVTMTLISLEYATTGKVNLVIKDFFRLFPLSLIQSGMRMVAEFFDPAHGLPRSSWFYAPPGTNSIYLY